MLCLLLLGIVVRAIKYHRQKPPLSFSGQSEYHIHSLPQAFSGQSQKVCICMHACTHSLHSLTFPITTGLKVGVLFLKVSSGTNLVTNTLDADVEQGYTEDGRFYVLS